MRRRPRGSARGSLLRRVPPTERPNPNTTRLDQASTAELVRLINREDARVAGAVRGVERPIVRAVNAIVKALRGGGRLFYAGAGSSGRLGVLDAAEIPPTFGFPSARVQAILAGGRRALRRASEAAEDSRAAGERDLRRRKVGRGDVVVVLSASGTTPYALGALREARRRGATTIAVTANPSSSLARGARIPICPETGPEVVAGSTRLKAGTAQKLILNTLSTAAMVRLGHVYRNLMVNVQMKSEKLRRRGSQLLQLALGLTPSQAERLLRASRGSLKVAIVMGQLGCSRREAERRLRITGGQVRGALERSPDQAP